ncbi:hypothetical protein [[Muricauda] lutisoli]|uniref:DUF4252 domain-containing protein n=1 Tax=[Muricauda] lutisoli TaxID=2816035 RepID=A0ABS3EUL5_9FLAO|nr:hypothetical protein [[Muricauda] lutisoli]MBO0329917.1 hypothetical protein [[Muricauda] lutisoli]
MKTRAIFLSFLAVVLFYGCAQDQSKLLINNFVYELVVSGKINNIEEFHGLGEEVRSKPNYLAFLEKYFIYMRKELVDDCNMDYEVLSYDEAKNSSLSTFHQYVKNYSKFKQVYFIICSGEIALPIIIENNRIISFQSNILKKSGGDYSPFLLNK